MISRSFITRTVDSSLLLQSIRRYCSGSLVFAAIAVVLRPSLADRRSSVPGADEEQSRATIEGVWAIACDSLIVRTGLRGVNAVLGAWRTSGTARQYAKVHARIESLEPPERIRLVGWIVLIGALTTGLIGGLAQGPWPGLSALIWAAVLAGAVVLVTGSHQALAAWKDYRTRRDSRP